MRIAEARITLGVAAACEGELEEAISQGRRAIDGNRQSRPSLAMVSQDLARVFNDRYKGEPEADAYRSLLVELSLGVLDARTRAATLDHVETCADCGPASFSAGRPS